MEHLDTLQILLSRARVSLEKSKTETERSIRTIWVSQLEKEVAGEKKFLGISEDTPTPEDDGSIEMFIELTDDQLLEELSKP